MNPPVVPSVTLPRIEKPAKQSADIINFYFKNKEQVLLAVLVFIFSFCSVAEAITKEDLESRGIYVECADVPGYYSTKLLKDAKFQSLKLNEEAQCNISRNEIAEAKKKLTKAISISSDDLVSKYLLLQIKFQESLGSSAGSIPDIDFDLYEPLMDKVKGDWPKRDFQSDPYYYLQEVGTVLTPYLIVLFYDFYKNSAESRVDARKEMGEQMIRLIGDKKSCNDIITRVNAKIVQYKIETADLIRKPIHDSAFEAYSKQAGIVKEIVCEDMQNMIDEFNN